MSCCGVRWPLRVSWARAAAVCADRCRCLGHELLRCVRWPPPVSWARAATVCAAPCRHVRFVVNGPSLGANHDEAVAHLQCHTFMGGDAQVGLAGLRAVPMRGKQGRALFRAMEDGGEGQLR
eukprot:335298-Chlamydomonas_euryale.AAC.5